MVDWTDIHPISVNDPYRNKAIMDEKEIHGNLTSPIQLDLDLKDINYPDSYNLVFYTQTNGTHEDFTNYIHVLPPRLFVSASENPMELRLGEMMAIHIFKPKNYSVSFSPSFISLSIVSGVISPPLNEVLVLGSY
jgi:hypothetical protein